MVQALMGRKILIMQHTPWQPPGPVLVQVLAELGCTLRIVEVWRESAGDFADYDALILLGGDCFFDQEDRFPCLREEKRLVRAWINLNRPCLGFSLGCHLLAETAGATITAGHLPSVGIIDGHITHEGRKHPLLQGLRSFRVEPPFDKLLVFYRSTEQALQAWRLMHGTRDLPRRLVEPPG